jgi:hypothetical protein
LVAFSEYKIVVNSIRNIASFFINGIEVTNSPISGNLPII